MHISPLFMLPARSYRTSVPAMATLERVVSENLHILPSVVLVYTAGIGMADNLAVFVFSDKTVALGIDLGILNEAVSDSSTCDLAYQSAGTFLCCFDNRVGNTAVLYDESIVGSSGYHSNSFRSCNVGIGYIQVLDGGTSVIMSAVVEQTSADSIESCMIDYEVADRMTLAVKYTIEETAAITKTVDGIAT